MDNLDQILGDEPIEEPQAEIPEEEAGAEPVEKTAEAENEGVKEEVESPPDSEPQTVPLKVVQEERKKRQALEARLAEFEAKSANAEPAQKTEYWDNPEAYIEERLATERKSISHQANFNARIEIGSVGAIEKYGQEVVDEASEAFAVAAQGSASLTNELNNAQNPVEFAVKWFKNQQAIEKSGGDVEAYIQAQVDARLAEASKNNPKQTAREAPSLASESNLGSRSSSEWKGTASLDEILGN